MSRIVRRLRGRRRIRRAAPPPPAPVTPAAPPPPPPPPAQTTAPAPTPAPTFGNNNMPVYNPAYANAPAPAAPAPAAPPPAPVPEPPAQVRRRMPPTGLAGGSFTPIGGGMLDMMRAAQVQTPAFATQRSQFTNTGLINSSMQRPAGSINTSQLQDQRQTDPQYLSSVDAERQGVSQFPVYNPFYNNRN